MSNINLIGHKDHETVTPASRNLKLVRGAAMFLLFGVSSAAIILSILIAFSPLPQVQQQERNALANLARSHPDMTKIAFLEDRLTSITNILAQRSNYGGALDSIVSKMPPGVTMTQIDLKKKNISLTVKSDSLSALTEFVDNLKTATKNKEYKTLTLDNITSDNLSNAFALTISVGIL